MELPIDSVETFLNSIPSTVRPTLTHFIAVIMTNCLDAYPQLNHTLRRRNLYKRAVTDIFIVTLLKQDAQYDLSGFLLENTSGKGVSEIARLSRDGALRLKEGNYREMEQLKKVALFIPGWMLTAVMRIQMFLQYSLNMSLKLIGLPDDHFGSLILSNFGPLGVENGLVPLSPYTRCPIMMGVGAPRKKAVVVGDEIVIRKCVTVSITFDHRYADGAHGAALMRRFEKMFRNPEEYRAIFIPEESAACTE